MTQGMFIIIIGVALILAGIILGYVLFMVLRRRRITLLETIKKEYENEAVPMAEPIPSVSTSEENKTVLLQYDSMETRETELLNTQHHSEETPTELVTELIDDNND